MKGPADSSRLSFDMQPSLSPGFADTGYKYKLRIELNIETSPCTYCDA